MSTSCADKSSPCTKGVYTHLECGCREWHIWCQPEANNNQWRRHWKEGCWGGGWFGCDLIDPEGQYNPRGMRFS